MFLDWIPQLLASLGEKSEAVETLVLRVAQAYPRALTYPLRLSAEKNSERSAFSRQVSAKHTSLFGFLFLWKLHCKFDRLYSSPLVFHLFSARHRHATLLGLT